MKLVRLSLRMLLRDLRAGELHLLALALVVAVTSLVSVGLLADRVGRTLEREANQLLGGDLLLRADQPWSAEFIDEARRRGLSALETRLFTSMVSTAEVAQLAGVKVVEAGYPLRGAWRIANGPNQPEFDPQRTPEPGEVWLDERLVAALGVQVGDWVGLGLREFRLGGMVTFETDRGTNFFSLLPRAIFNLQDLDSTGLLTVGSRATYRLHFAGELREIEAFEAWATPRLSRGQAVESIDNAQPQVRNALDQAQRFLRLAALLAVVLAAVAIGLSARRYLLRHLDACAVMRCLGAKQGEVLRLFLLEFAWLGSFAALLGGVLGWGVQSVLASALSEVFQTRLPLPSLVPLLHGAAIALVLLLGFALPQLLRLYRVPTLRVLRRELGQVSAAPGLAWGAGAAALLALIFWIAQDLRLGVLVAAGFLLALGGFALVARGILEVLTRWRGAGPSGGWRYGIAALGRRMTASVIQATALGVGLTAILLLTLIQADLLESWRNRTPPDAPNRFVINIQPDQRAGVEQHFADAGLPDPQLQAMIRGRWVALNGVPIDPESYSEPRAQRLAEREFNLSFGSRLPAQNVVVGGAWHGETQGAEFSVEEGLAELFGLKLGDVVSFEVAGQRVDAPITSVRELDWDSMQVNFFFIASPEVLDGRPASFITSFHLPPEQAVFTAGLVQAFPNLSVIDVDAILRQVQTVMNQVIRVVQFVFAFSLLAGLLVLYAALQSTHDEREYELAMLRTLGARNRQLRQALLVEFSVLGLVAGLMAGIGASVIGWLLAEQAFQLAYAPGLLPVAVGVLAGLLGFVGGGWLGVRRLLQRPPLVSLRALT